MRTTETTYRPCPPLSDPRTESVIEQACHDIEPGRVVAASLDNGTLTVVHERYEPLGPEDVVTPTGHVVMVRTAPEEADVDRLLASALTDRGEVAVVLRDGEHAGVIVSTPDVGRRVQMVQL